MIMKKNLILIGAFLLVIALAFAVINPSLNTEASMQPLFPFKMNGKFGYMDNKGKIKIEPKFYDAKYFTYGVAPVKINNSDTGWGYIDTKGRVVISPKYKDAFYFIEKHAQVNDGSGDRVIINRNGNKVKISDKEYQDMYRCYIVGVPLKFKIYRGPEVYQGQNGKEGVKNKDGKVIIPPQFEMIVYGFNEGLATVARNSKSNGFKCGYINLKGKVVIPYQYDYAEFFSEGAAYVYTRENGTVHAFYINNIGKKVIDMPPGYLNGDAFAYGIARITSDNNDLVYMNKKGKIIKPHR